MDSAESFGALMHEVCVERGWCGSIVDGQARHVTDYLPKKGDVTAEQFAAWLFDADGVDPEEDQKWRSHFDALRDAFVRHMGSDTVNVERLIWNV